MTAGQDSKAQVTGQIDVRYVANLARLQLTEDEIATFQSQLDHIVHYVDEIRGLNVEGVEPMAHAAVIRNVFREDTVRPGLDRDKALANAPAHRSELFMVPKIVE